MKPGWEVKPLGDVCRIVNGATPDTKVPEYWGGPHAWITPAEMGRRATPFVSETARTLSDEGLSNCSATLVPPQSVILSSRAPIGHLVINEVPMATNQGCKSLVPPKDLNSSFLYYYLLSQIELLESLGTGTTFKELSAAKLREVPILLPPLDEQRRIVAILDEAFEGIAKAKAHAEQNIKNAQAVFDSFLSETFDYERSRWKRKPIGECVRFIDYRGRTPEKTRSGLRLITAKNVKRGYLQTEPAEYVDPAAYDELMTRGIPKEGDVLFTTEAPLGNVAQLDTSAPVVFAQRVIIMQPDRGVVDPDFVKYALLAPPFQARVRADATGATALGIKASLLKKIDIVIPVTVEEQARVAGRLRSLELECGALAAVGQRKLAALDELKQSLLHQAFTGNL